MSEQEDDAASLGAFRSSTQNQPDHNKPNAIKVRWAKPEDKDVHCFLVSESDEVFPQNKVPECLLGYMCQQRANFNNGIVSSNCDSTILGDLTCQYCHQFLPEITDSEEMEHHEEYCKSLHTAMKDRIDGGKNEQCAVCLDIVYDKPSGCQEFGILSCCSHVFCYSCVSRWFIQDIVLHQENVIIRELALKKGCPVCRQVPVVFAPCAWLISDRTEKKKYFSDHAEGIKFVLDHSCSNCKTEQEQLWQAWSQGLSLINSDYSSS